jgi:hypothetical protein
VPSGGSSCDLGGRLAACRATSMVLVLVLVLVVERSQHPV